MKSVKSSHRKDNEHFYATHTFYSFEDFKKQLAVYNTKYSNFPIKSLDWKTTTYFIKACLATGEVLYFLNA